MIAQQSCCSLPLGLLRLSIRRTVLDTLADHNVDMTCGLFGAEPRLALALRAMWVLELPFDDAGEDFTRPRPWARCSEDIHCFPTLEEDQRGRYVNGISMRTFRIDLASTAGGKSSSSIRAVNLLYAAMRADAASA